MPNWCSTEITITCKDMSEAKKLYELVEDWTSSDKMENGFGHNWLGNVVLGSGIGTVDEDVNTDIRCRGYITDKYYSGNKVRISTETAWAPMLRMWVLIMAKYTPGAQINYEAVESGMEIYSTNWQEMAGTYYVDIWDHDTSYCETEENAKRIMQLILKSDEENFEKLAYELEEEELGVCHPWEIVPVTEWD